MSFTVKGFSESGIERDIRYSAEDALQLVSNMRARGFKRIQITTQHGDRVDEEALVRSRRR